MPALGVPVPARRWFSRAILAATVVAICGTGDAASAPPSPDTAPVVCLSSRVAIEVKDGGSSAVRREERIYAVRSLGEEADALRGIGVVRSFESHPVSVEATVTGSKGIRLVRRLDEFLDLPFLTLGSFVSDARLLTTALPPLREGDTLRVREETRLDPFLGFPLFTLGEPLHPTMEALYEVSIDADLQPRYRVFSGAGEPEERRKGSRVIWIWRAGPLVPPEEEELSPPAEDLLPTVSVGLERMAWGPCGTWEELAASYESRLPEKTFAPVEESLASDWSEEGLSTAEKILGRVQSNIRYVAIELGPGGKIPHAADEVLRRRYGDCKDMATLALTCLRRAGEEGSLAIVRTRPPSGCRVDPLPTLNYFNHAIACTGPAEDPSWLDATARCGTVRRPRPDIQGAPALVVSGPARGFHRIPWTAAAENRTGRTLRLVEDASGWWTAEVTLAMTGARAQSVNRYLQEGGEAAEVIAGHLKRVGLDPIAPVEASQISLGGGRPDSLRIHCALPIADPTTRTGARFALRPPWDSDPAPLHVFKTRERKSDVCWSSLETILDTLEVRAERLRFDALPDSGWTLAAEGVEVSMRSEPLTNGCRLTRSVIVSQPVFPIARWEEGRDLRRRMIRWCTSEISAALP